MSFYITLPSNSSLKDFPKNTPGEFTVPLPHPIHLPVGEGCEVGMAEIQYTKSWFNIPEEQVIKVGPKEVEISEGFYPTLEVLTTELNFQLKKFEEKMRAKDQGTFSRDRPPPTIRFSTFSFTKKTRLKVREEVTALEDNEIHPEDSVTLSPFLSDMLGFQKTGPYEIGKYKSTYPADIMSGLYNLFVYCDIVQPNLVGHTKVPLLRIVPVEEGHIITKSYNNIFYHPLSREIIHSIQVHIKSDTNKTVPFNTGKSIVTLHFRRSQK